MKVCDKNKTAYPFYLLKTKSWQSGSPVTQSDLDPGTLRPILWDSVPFSAFLKYCLNTSPSLLNKFYTIL